jgi:hypothetical protein
MTARRYQSGRRAPCTRELVPRRSRALDDSSTDELDEWMVGCPAADPFQSTR